jgi:hypothetical protein
MTGGDRVDGFYSILYPLYCFLFNDRIEIEKRIEERGRHRVKRKRI